MTQRKPTTKLGEIFRDKQTEAYKAYRELMAIHKEGEAIIEQMPVELTDIRWYLFKKLEPGKWYLETWGIEEKEADEFIKRLKLMGIYGMKSSYHSFNDTWEYKGSISIDGTEIIIKIDGGSKPPNCRIEKTTETKEVITYKAICEETEEEV